VNLTRLFQAIDISMKNRGSAGFYPCYIREKQGARSARAAPEGGSLWGETKDVKHSETEVTPRSSQSIRRRRRLWRDTCVVDGTPQRGAPTRSAGAGGLPRGGNISSEGWKIFVPAFRRLEEMFPGTGKIRRTFSEGWKNPAAFFQTLEILRAVFPSIGKNGVRFSRRWKNSLQGLEKTGIRFPDVGKNSAKVSRRWKKSFRGVGKIRRVSSRHWKAAAKRGLAGACAGVGLRFLPGVCR